MNNVRRQQPHRSTFDPLSFVAHVLFYSFAAAVAVVMVWLVL